ncbi:MAG TPA: hypothetical protein VMZ71_04995 [Gemmataceae bacterium]|nr:hypothetical protein [Gemmataceae bacterium]
MRVFVGRLAAMGVVLALGAASGCGGGTGNVSGVVKFKGQPLGGGQVQFKGGNNPPVGVDLKPDGTFRVAGVPTGTVKVAVSYVDPRVMEHYKNLSGASREGKAPPKGSVSQFDKIPPKYGDFTASGLTIEVKPGKNEGVEIDLKEDR